MAELERKTLTLDDGAVSILDAAREAPLLHFAHATGFNAETYRGLLTPLTGRFHVAAADQRGHGFTTLSAVPGPQAAWANFAADLARVLDAVDRGPAILAGHSMGAIVSMMVAARHPARVRGLVLVEPVLVPRFSRHMMRLRRLLPGMSTPGGDLATMAAKRRAIFPSFEMVQSAYRGRGAFKTWKDETVADYLRGGLIPTGNGTEMRLACEPLWESAIFQNAPPGIARLARQVRCPLTLIYCGTGTAKAREVGIVARNHGNARLVQVPETTHFLPMERPDIVQDEIERMGRATELG
jgi:pimeloyl-ACP methyl ester carboxylesterase